MSKFDLPRREFLASAALVPIFATASNAHASPPQSPASATPVASRLRFQSLQQLADLVGTVPRAPSGLSDPGAGWRPAVEAASLLFRVGTEDIRTVLALCADRGKEHPHELIIDAQLLCFLDLVFECRDQPAKDARKRVEWIYAESGEPGIPPRSDDLVAFIHWAKELPEFRREFQGYAIGGAVGPHESVLPEFDRRIAIGCKPRSRLKRFYLAVTSDLGPSILNDLDRLVGFVHTRNKQALSPAKGTSKSEKAT